MKIRIGIKAQSQQWGSDNIILTVRTATAVFASWWRKKSESQIGRCEKSSSIITQAQGKGVASSQLILGPTRGALGGCTDNIERRLFAY
jgi:hypothetical protein